MKMVEIYKNKLPLKILNLGKPRFNIICFARHNKDLHDGTNNLGKRIAIFNIRYSLS